MTLMIFSIKQFRTQNKKKLHILHIFFLYNSFFIIIILNIFYLKKIAFDFVLCTLQRFLNQS